VKERRLRAIRVERFGGPEVLRVVSVEAPAPSPGEVLVRVATAGVNPVDWKVRAGGAGERFGRPPYVPGWDVAGVVEATGDGVSAFAVGDEVFGMPRFPEPAGCYADYLCAPADHLAAAPAGMDRVAAAGMDRVAAAGLPLAGLTALQVLDLVGVTEGQRVLVHAAAGGVGHLAVQLAKARGAYVIGTGRANKHPFLYELGIDEAVDYTTVAFEEAIEDVDVVVNLVGGDYGRRSLRVLRPGGVLAMIVGVVARRWTRRRRRPGSGSSGIWSVRTAMGSPGWPSWPAGAGCGSRSRTCSRWSRRRGRTSSGSVATRGARSCWPSRADPASPRRSLTGGRCRPRRPTRRSPRLMGPLVFVR
jgi:NADPH:quinone reductase-like Zn-dependent oxidoreductase